MSGKLLYSYPKCGRTWLRLMLGTVAPDYRLIASHVKSLVDTSTYFLLIRHPFDVAVSFYHSAHNLYPAPHRYHFEGTMTEYVRTRYPNILKQYQQCYIHRQNAIDFARYEDMIIDPGKVLTQLLTYLELTVDPILFEKATSKTFGQYQTGELDGSLDLDLKTAKIAWSPSLNAKSLHFRSGTIGSHKTEVSVDDLEFMRNELDKYDPKEMWGYV